MRRFANLSLLLAMLALSVAGPAIAEVAAYPCENVREGQGKMRLDFLEELEQGPRDSAESEEARLLQLQRQALTDTERASVSLQLAILYADSGRTEQARSQLEGLLGNPYLPRAQLDVIRTALARIALADKDADRAIALLEPVATAACAPLPPQAVNFLTHAYLQKGRDRDALGLLVRAGAPTGGDADGWRAVRVELHCKLEGAAACLDAIGQQAARGGLSPDLSAVLEALLAKAIAAGGDPLSLQDRGLVDAQLKLVPQAAVQIQPLELLRRLAPVYPATALREGISGFVKLLIRIDAEGTVLEASVLDASPKGVFENSALRAARKARFRPMMVDGIPTAAQGSYTVHYRMAPR